MKKAKKTRPIIILVFILVAISLFSTSTLAKYTSSEDGTGSLSVASFSTEMSSSEVTFEAVTLDTSTQFEFAVKNKSAVDVTYQILVLSTGNLPIDFTLELVQTVNETETIEQTATATYANSVQETGYWGDSFYNCYYISEDFMTLSYSTEDSDIATTSGGETSHTYKLSTDFSDVNFQSEYNGMVDVFQVYVIFTQSMATETDQTDLKDS